MSDIIQLLPDAVANQIAAGEVVQRPASAVKELIENAIDAGATKIQLIVKDAGKELIQIIDDGSGMSVTDARLCFERHATSKIKKAEDLFAIRTMGFRGEAMASIAAIAQVELKTKRPIDDLGTHIFIEGSEVLNQEPCNCVNGTTISVKNLYYNTPARRNFLKSNPVEMRHIIDEFQRVALAHFDIYFTLHHNGQEIYHLPKSTLKQRIIHLFGNNYNERLVPVEEETSIINVAGFVGKPGYAKRTRGEQFFFVNNRFIKDNYLNHAVNIAFESLLPQDCYPFYVLFIEIDPAKIDINVHPTKTEIKYQDEKAIYAIIRSAVKRALGKYNISPTLDFNQETGFSQMITPKLQEDIVPPAIRFNPDFNPFSDHRQQPEKTAFRGNNFGAANAGFPKNWQTLYEITEQVELSQPQLNVSGNEVYLEEQPITPAGQKAVFQLHNRFIISQIKSGFMLIDQQAAHERILYERFLAHLDQNQGISQQLLFPQTVSFSAPDFALIQDLLPDFFSLGFRIREFGKNALIIEGAPADLPEQTNIAGMLEKLIEEFKNNQSGLKLDKRTGLAQTLARNAALKSGTALNIPEMINLIDQLFACTTPNIALSGKPVVVTYTIDELFKKFEHK